MLESTLYKTNTTQQQTTSYVVMVTPDSFQFNDETAQTNAFQQPASFSPMAIQELAQQEFIEMVELLRSHAIHVTVAPSRHQVTTPDAVFPNNWFSIQRLQNGDRVAILYPLLAHSRRLERQWDTINNLLRAQNIQIDHVLDFTRYEQENKYLEGTGSLVLDHVHKIAYAALSPRTSPEVLQTYCAKTHYAPMPFHTCDNHGSPIYHTNVMMSIGTHFVVIAAECILDSFEREQVLKQLHQHNKEIIFISLRQATQMAANILELRSTSGKAKIILSATAYAAYTPEQHQQLAKFGELVVVSIPTIEQIGGGSARCMLAEVF